MSEPSQGEVETTKRSRDAQACRDRCALEALGNLLIGLFLDQAQNQ